VAGPRERRISGLSRVGVADYDAAVSSGPRFEHAAIPPPGLQELDRRLRWRIVPLLIFGGMMIGLGVAAAISLLRPRDVISGIPDDADARAAYALIGAQPPPGTGALRFHSELTGEAESRGVQPAPGAASAARALLERAEARHLLDPRLPAALAHLDLARHRFEHAERNYRRALMIAPHYGEARLGLGVAYALHAEREADPLEQRSLRLQAIAQFAAVPAKDPMREHALYDRALLLAEVGRSAEAARRAREYLQGYGGTAWAESLRARVPVEE
jgi:tetratricopeptide (TPR) repeat protein